MSLTFSNNRFSLCSLSRHNLNIYLVQTKPQPSEGGEAELGRGYIFCKVETFF